MILIPDTLYTFDDHDALSQTADDLPEVERHEIYAHHADDDRWERLPYRHSLWIEDGGPVGDVSASTDYYNVIQYGDILDAVATAIDAYPEPVTPTGHVALSDSGHRLSAYIDFEEVDAEPEPGDVIDLGLHIRAGHTGFHGIKYDVGATRQICSNGMVGFVSDLAVEQTHQKPLDYGLARQAVDGILAGVGIVEDRLAQANEQTFTSEDEALLVLLDHGLDAYFDDPVATLRDSLRAELDQDQQLTLYDTYNAATRAVTHAATLPVAQRDAALDQAATLLDRWGDLPDATVLGRQAVEHRAETYAAEDAVDPYWADEEATLHDLLAVHAGGEA